MGAIDEIALKAQEVLFFNRDAKYIILSIPAYQHLKARKDGVINFMIDKNGLETFMGRPIAFIQSGEIIIDVGGVNGNFRQK